MIDSILSASLVDAQSNETLIIVVSAHSEFEQERLKVRKHSNKKMMTPKKPDKKIRKFLGPINHNDDEANIFLQSLNKAKDKHNKYHAKKLEIQELALDNKRQSLLLREKEMELKNHIQE